MKTSTEGDRQAKSVRFDSLLQVYTIYEGSEWNTYRKPYWMFVRADRARIEDAITRILDRNHRDIILKKNGVI